MMNTRSVSALVLALIAPGVGLCESNAIPRRPLPMSRVVSSSNVASSAVTPAQPQFGEAASEAFARLNKPGARLADLVLEVSHKPPDTAQQAMFKLAVCLRAGVNAGAIEALKELKGFSPGLSDEQIRAIYYDACDHAEAWDVARVLVEEFAANARDLSLSTRLLKHLLGTGWTASQVDDWLRQKPAGVDGFWIKERYRFNVEQGTAASLQKELDTAARAHPEDVQSVLAYLDVLQAAGVRDPMPDLKWMTNSVHPARATEAEEVGSRLRALQAFDLAVVLYRRAVEIPLTDDEVRERSMTMQVILPGVTVKAGMEASMREALAECLLKTGGAGEAQKWMVEAADIRKAHALGRNPFLAGRVQAASGGRVVENRMKAEEAVSDQDPRYWSDRAQYYQGRSEPAAEEAALKRGLALAVPVVRDPAARRGKQFNMDARAMLLGQYVSFLIRDKRPAEAVALLEKELAEAPPLSESSQNAARLLSFDLEKYVNAENPALWRYLEGRPQWEFTDERLLWRMLQKAGEQGRLEVSLDRAEKLAKGQDPTRAQTLGWIENRLKQPARSIPLLQYALAEAKQPELREKIAFDLFTSYLDTGNWKLAEELFLQGASRHLTLREYPEWYARIALLAAKAGDKADAMRIWERVANLDLTLTQPVGQIAKAGMTNELAQFYRALQEAIPGSSIPPRVLASLTASATSGR